MTEIGRPDLRMKLMAMVIKSFRFGLKEFYWYISTAYKEKVNIFLGINRWPKVIYSDILVEKGKMTIQYLKIKFNYFYKTII